MSLLNSLFASSVDIFANQAPARKFRPDLSKMHTALQYCTTAGLLEPLSEKLNGVDIIGQYELYIRAAPWKRYPATLVLKQVSAMLTVRIFYPVSFSLNRANMI